MTVVRTRLVALLLLVAITAAACGSTTDSDSSAGSESTDVFDGEFATLDGASVNLADFEGQDVVLWFWAPW